jgi:Fe-S cluster biosynthesis and repair protein YggX
VVCETDTQRFFVFLISALTKELGQRILANVSKQGWQQWLDHQTMLINENNLNMLDENAQSYLKALIILAIVSILCHASAFK